MRYGRFDDDAKEYVIERPDTPKAWTNYLGDTTYGSIITNHAGGYSFYRSSAQGRFLRSAFHAVPTEQPGRYFYLRDQDTGETWSTSWQPMARPLAEYRCECRHGTAYTTIEADYRQVRSVVTYFVPLGASFEVWWLKLENKSDRVRTLRVMTYAEFASEWNVQHDMLNQQYSQYIVRTEVHGQGIAQSSLGSLPEDPEHFENRDQSRHTFFSLSGADVIGFDTNRDSFLGPYRTYQNPLTVETGEPTGSLADGDNACASLTVEVTLQPGEQRDLLVLMGVGRLEREGAAARRQVPDAAAARAALSDLRSHWHSRLGRVTVRSPDPAFDSMVNVWNAYNSLITFAWSRAASLVYAGARDGLGYRDTVQDTLGVLPAIHEEARPRLELMLTGQCSTGGAMPVVKPFNHHPGREALPPSYRSDDCLWLFFTVPEYVRESGNLDFYQKVLPYADTGEASVMGHLRRAIEFNLDRRGAHGLPCGLEADWNDCLNFGDDGESTFVAFQLRHALREYADIAELMASSEEGRWAQSQLATLDAAIQEHAWDGKWFLRGFREGGATLGSSDDAEGSIYLNAQSWAVLSGAARPEQATLALDAAHARLATRFGLALCDPPYRSVSHRVIRSVLYNPGQKENGGIFCHPQAWAVMAEIAHGNRDRAFEYFRAYMPSAYNEEAEVRQVEPYVHCQSTHGPASNNHGKSRLPWLSGTASWSYFCAVTSILGVMPQYRGLRLSPAIPSTWPEVHIERTFRGKHFEIHVKNGGAGRIQRCLCNGVSYPDGFVPESAFQQRNRVEIELG